MKLTSPVILSSEQRSEAVRRYAAGETLRQLAAAFGCSEKPIRNALKGANVQRRPRGSKPLVVRPDCFADPGSCERAAYYIGFLLADGCLYEKRPGHFVVNLGVQMRDREVIDGLNEFVGGRYKVKVVTNYGEGGYAGGPQARLAFSHPQMVSDLMRHGLTPRKSFTAELPPHLAFNRHVWRGLIDGDGFVSWNKGNPNKPVPVIGFIGSKAMVAQFVDFARSLSSGVDVGIRPRDRNEITVYSTYISGRHAKAFAQHVYSNCAAALSRKLRTAASVMMWEGKFVRPAARY